MTLTVSGLSLEIESQTLLEKLSFEVKAGQLWGVIGSNGIGKTTLLRTILGIHPFVSGTISIDQIPIQQLPPRTRAQKIAFMQQEYEMNFPGNVIDAVLMSRFPYLQAWHLEQESDRKIVQKILQDCRLDSLAGRQINSLSGGEKRRLHLAMLLAQQARYLLLDEPTNHLDVSSQIYLMQRLQEYLSDNDAAGIMVSHDINLVSHFCTHVLLLFSVDEHLCGTVEHILKQHNIERLLQHPAYCWQKNNQRYFIPAYCEPIKAETRHQKHETQ